jgi:hypothetical protein
LSLVGQKAISAATITPQHPCCPHGTTTKKTKSQTPWTHSEPFLLPKTSRETPSLATLQKMLNMNFFKLFKPK